MAAGVGHGQDHHKAEGHDGRGIDIEAMFKADGLEPQRDIFRRTAEGGVGQRIGQRHPQGADIGGIKFRLHHRVDGGVAALHDHGADQDEENHQHRAALGDRGHHRIGDQRAAAERHQQHRLPAHLVRDPADQGLDQHEDEQRGRAQFGGLVAGEAGGVGQEFLHIGGVDIESQRPAGGQAQYGEGLARKSLEQHLGAAQLFARRAGILEGFGFLHPAPQPEGDHRQNGADHKGYAPAPFHHRVFADAVAQADQHGERNQLSGDQGDVVEAGPEAAIGLAGHFAHIGRAGAILAAQRQSLQDAGDEQDGGREDADRRGAGGEGDDQRAQAHQGDGNHHRILAAITVRIAAHHPGADGPREKAHREDARGLQQLGGLVALGEEDRREIERGGRIGVPVIPFDQIADGPGGDGAQPLLDRLWCCHAIPPTLCLTCFAWPADWWGRGGGTTPFLRGRGRQAHPLPTRASLRHGCCFEPRNRAKIARKPAK